MNKRRWGVDEAADEGPNEAADEATDEAPNEAPNEAADESADEMRLPRWTITRPSCSKVVSLTQSFAQWSNRLAETAIDRPTNGWAYGQMDGRMDVRTDGRMEDRSGSPT